jgi:hypothetical protein
MSDVIDFDGINVAALRNGRSFVESLLPGGKFRSLHYIVKTPSRNDQHPGSFSINYRMGAWKDSASGKGGSDPISLTAHVRGISQSEAARQVSRKLGVPLYKNNGAANGQHKQSNHGASGQLQFSSADPPAAPDPLLGLSVELPGVCGCAATTALIGTGTGPHRASLHCASCSRHRGWVTHTTAAFILKLIDQFGRPTEPIIVRRGQYPPLDSGGGASSVHLK